MSRSRHRATDARRPLVLGIGRAPPRPFFSTTLGVFHDSPHRDILLAALATACVPWNAMSQRVHPLRLFLPEYCPSAPLTCIVPIPNREHDIRGLLVLIRHVHHGVYVSSASLQPAVCERVSCLCFLNGLLDARVVIGSPRITISTRTLKASCCTPFDDQLALSLSIMHIKDRNPTS